MSLPPAPEGRSGQWARLATSGWASTVLAVAGGVLWGLQFGRRELLVAPWLALVPFFALLVLERPVRFAFLHGVVSWLTAIPWIVATLVTYGGLPGPLAGLCLLLLASYLALFPALFAALGSALWRSTGRGASLVALVGLPALWVALEWLRGHLLSGFPWNLAGYAWIGAPGALALSSWIGAYGLSGLVVFANAAVTWGLLRRRWEVAALGVGLPLLLLMVAGRKVDTEGLGQRPPAHAVRIVQPNIANQVIFDRQETATGYQRLLRMTREACDRPGALVIWPESAAWPFNYGEDALLAGDVAALVAGGCPLLFNTARATPEGSWYNSALLVAADPEGHGLAEHRYDKRHLVPFGEYVPFAGLFGFLDRLARNAGDFRAADQLVLLPWGEEKLGPAICFEVIFPEEVAAASRAGASVLVTITNDAWYGDTAAPWQHLRAARFRAAENRKPLLRAAITGVSAVVAADGALVASLGVGREGILRATVSGNDILTPYARRPWLVPLVAALLAALAILAARRRPRRPGPPAVVAPASAATTTEDQPPARP